MMAAREAASLGGAIGIMRGHADEVNGVAFVRGGKAIRPPRTPARGCSGIRRRTAG